MYVQVIRPRCFGELHNQLRQIESNLTQFTLMFRHRVVLDARACQQSEGKAVTEFNILVLKSCRYLILCEFNYTIILSQCFTFELISAANDHLLSCIYVCVKYCLLMRLGLENVLFGII